MAHGLSCSVGRGIFLQTRDRRWILSYRTTREVSHPRFCLPALFAKQHTVEPFTNPFSFFFFTNPFSKSRYFTFSCYTLFSWPECTVLDYKGQLTFFCWPFQLYDILSSSGVFAMILPSDVASEPFNQHSAQLQSTHDNIFTQPTYYRNQCGSPRRGLHVFLKDLKCLLLELLFDVEVCRTYVFKRIVGSWWLLFSSWNVHKWLITNHSEQPTRWVWLWTLHTLGHLLPQITL